MISAPLFSRLLDTNGYGVMSVFNVWTGVVAIVFTLQTQGTIVNARVEYADEEQSGYQSSVMALSSCSFLMFSAVVLLFRRQISALLELNTFLIVLILVQSFGSYCVSFLNSKYTYEFQAEKNMLISLGTAVSSMALALLLIYWLPNELNYYGRIVGNAAVYAVFGLAACVIILVKGKRYYYPEYWRFCLSLSIPVVFYSLSDLLLGHSDLVMVRNMLGDSASGIYGLSYNYSGLMFMIFGALNNTWVAFFFDDMKNGRREAVRAQEKNFLELFTVLCIGFILLTKEVFQFYSKYTFWDGIILVPLFTGSYFLNFLCTFPVNYEYYRKKTKAVAVITITSALVNVGLNFVFIRSMGIFGAALATMLSHSIQFAMHHCYACLILGKKDYPFGTFTWLPYGLAFAGIAVLVYLTPNMWLLRWGLGAGIGIWELLQMKKRKRIF